MPTNPQEVDLDWIDSLQAIPDKEMLEACVNTPNLPPIRAVRVPMSTWLATSEKFIGYENNFMPWCNGKPVVGQAWQDFEKKVLLFVEAVHKELSVLGVHKAKTTTNKDDTPAWPARIVSLKDKTASVCKARALIRGSLRHHKPYVTPQLRNLLTELGYTKVLEELQKSKHKGAWRRAHQSLGKDRQDLRKKKRRAGRTARRAANKNDRTKNIFLWHNKRSALYRQMADKDMPTPTEDIFHKATKYYDQENQSQNPPGFTVKSMPAFIREVLPFQGSATEQLHWTIDVLDIRTFLKEANQNSAGGWDSIQYKSWKNLPGTHHTLACIYEVCRTTKRIPMLWQTANAILIPKKEVLTEGKDLRPIMLQCNIYKMFAGIIGKKIHTYAKKHKIWSDEQRGFTDVNGTMLNLFLLQFAKENLRRNRQGKSLYVLFTDIQNAFGSLEYKQLIAILYGLGIPRGLCELIWAILRGGAMKFSYKESTISVLQKRGCKQGDPLSPIVFNLLLEPIWRVWRKNNSGYTTAGMVQMQIPSLGFADDMALLSSTKPQLEHSLQLLLQYFEWLALKLVPAKCGLLKHQYTDKGVAFDDDWTVVIAGHKVPIIDPKESTPKDPKNMRYLGSWFNRGPRCHMGMAALVQVTHKKLDLLTEISLPIRYKLAAINQWILDASYYSLFNEHVRVATELEEIQTTVYKYIRAWCKLPDNSSLDILTLPWHEGGIDLHHIRRLNDMAVAKKYQFLLTGKMDPTAQQIVEYSMQDSAKARRTVGNFVGKATVATDTVKSFWSRAHDVALKYGAKWKADITELSPAIVHNAAVAEIVQGVPKRVQQGAINMEWRKNRCLNYGTRKSWAPPDHYLKFFIKAYLQLLPTNAERTPMINNGNCKRCGNKETQMHVLNNCKYRADHMVARHNMVQDKLLKYISHKPGDVRWVDQHIPKSYYTGKVQADKPDIFIKNDRGKTITIIEVAVPYETCMVASRGKKLDKYKPLLEAIRKKHPKYKVTLTPVVIGCLGGYNATLIDDIMSLGIVEKLDKLTSDLHEAAVSGSQWLWNRRYNFGS